jgi:hypothetical protein
MILGQLRRVTNLDSRNSAGVKGHNSLFIQTQHCVSRDTRGLKACHPFAPDLSMVFPATRGG